MSRFNRGRGRGGRGAAFGGFSSDSDHPSQSVHASILKNARRSGILNLSQKGLETVPENVWTLQEDVPEEARTVNLDSTEDKWWDTNDLTKLILASNRLTSIGEGLRNLESLTVLDLHDNQLTSLPKALGSLENLRKLDIGHNQLTELPANLGILQNLVTLLASRNKLQSLCEDICSLKNLDQLDISHNQIETLPRYICLLCHLRTLDVSHNKLNELPADMGGLSALVTLDATHNRLLRLPDELGLMDKLEMLYLRHNRLESLPTLRNCGKLKEILVGNNNIRGLGPEQLTHLKSLTTLDVRDNKLQKVPDEICMLDKLERLDLTNNDISALPYSLGTMIKLKAIVLDGNPLRSVRRDIIMRGTQELKKYLASRLTDEECDKQTANQVTSSNVGQIGGSDGVRASDLREMKALDYSNKKVPGIPDEVLEAALEAGVKTVNLSKNILTDVPINLSVLSKNITDLNLGINKIIQLSPSIAQFTNLQRLDLRSNQMTDLPGALGTMTTIRELTLSTNRFKSIPQCVYNLAALETLFLNDNQISGLDVTSLAKLTRLANLDLQNNDLNQIPPELGNCTWLKSLSLTGNPLKVPRSAILAKGTLAILEYLRGRITS